MVILPAMHCQFYTPAVYSSQPTLLALAVVCSQMAILLYYPGFTSTLWALSFYLSFHVLILSHILFIFRQSGLNRPAVWYNIYRMHVAACIL